MECPRSVQTSTTLSQALPCLFGSLDSDNISRYHYLTRRIEIGAYQYFVLSAFIADTLGVFMSSAQQRIHCTRTFLARLGHGTSTHIE